MSDNITTTKDLFKVVDITHKPKRMQGDNFVGTDLHIKSQEETSTPNNDDTDIPEYVTLERAIEFYNNHANITTYKGKLYSATVSWLKELLSLRATKLTALADSKTNVLVASLNGEEKEEEDDSTL